MFGTRTYQRHGQTSDATGVAPGKQSLTGSLARSSTKRVREHVEEPAAETATAEVAIDPLDELRDADPVLGLDRSRGVDTNKRTNDGTDRHTPLGRDKRPRNPVSLAALLATHGRAMSLPILDAHAAQLEDPSLAHLRGEAEPLLDAARAVAEKPTVKRQRTMDPKPSTEPAVEPEYDDFEAAWLADTLTRLDAIFTLHVEENASVVPSAKAASVARHATIGEQAVLALLAPPGEDEAPLAALRSRQRIATELEARLSAELEQPVTLKVHFPTAEEVAEQSTIILEIVIAPNDWWTVLVISAAVTAAATGAMLWRWCVRRGATGDTPRGDGRAPTEARTAPPSTGSDRPAAPARDPEAPAQADAQPEPPLPIQGLPRPIGRNDCFVNSVLQLLAATYPEVLTADANIDVDVIIQNVSQDGTTDFSFTVNRGDYDKAMALLQKTAEKLKARGVVGDNKTCKVSAVGVGMHSHPGVASKMFGALGAEGINIKMISTSEIKISVVIDEKYLELAVRVLHKVFGLDKE